MAEVRIFEGIYEKQASSGSESDLKTHYTACKKNAGHKRFISFDDFTMLHLPEKYQDVDIFKWIKATFLGTVRLAVSVINPNRPEYFPETTHAKRYNYGTGMVRRVFKYTFEDNNGLCKCQKCLHSDTPSENWCAVFIYTAAHIVCNDLEAKHTTCRLFFTQKESPLITIDGSVLLRVNIDEDRSVLVCFTCDLNLLDKLYEVDSNRRRLWWTVYTKYQSLRNVDTFIFIVSHPHGCPMAVSLGEWVDRTVKWGDSTSYTYTTCTCPGSSGAHVNSLWWGGWLSDHVHKGVNEDGVNCCSVGRD